jgi:hypothetical protein
MQLMNKMCKAMLKNVKNAQKQQRKAYELKRGSQHMLDSPWIDMWKHGNLVKKKGLEARW